MREALLHLNYVHVLVVAIVGFAFGAAWYSPLLFAKAWMAEMKIDPAAEPRPSMVPSFIKGFIFTLISTWGLALLIQSHGVLGRVRGAEFGAVVGALIVSARYLNASVWEKRSCKLRAIYCGHEVLLFAIQGAILGYWR